MTLWNFYLQFINMMNYAYPMPEFCLTLVRNNLHWLLFSYATQGLRQAIQNREIKGLF